MKAYRTTIKEQLPELCEEKVTIPKHGLTLNPLVNWKDDKAPFWWDSYNHVKHRRDTKFNEANLKHTLNAIASLGLIVLYFYREELTNEEGKSRDEIDFIDITKNFHSKSSLIEFNSRYTYDHIVYRPR